MRNFVITESGVFANVDGNGEKEIAVGTTFPVPDDAEVPSFLAGKGRFVDAAPAADASFVTGEDTSSGGGQEITTEKPVGKTAAGKTVAPAATTPAADPVDASGQASGASSSVAAG